MEVQEKVVTNEDKWTSDSRVKLKKVNGRYFYIEIVQKVNVEPVSLIAKENNAVIFFSVLTHKICIKSKFSLCNTLFKEYKASNLKKS